MSTFISNHEFVKAAIVSVIPGRAPREPGIILTIMVMDSGPAPQVGNCRPMAHPRMTN
jgi:hypothetical protein